MNRIKSMIVGMVSLLAISCNTPQNISYFQDSADDTIYQIDTELDLRLRKGDKLSIVVHSRDPQLSQMFNLPVASQRVGYTTLANSTQQMSAYTVNEYGRIDFPSLGFLDVEGLNRTQVAKLIKDQLTEKDLLKEPVVTVEFDNMFINVLGEVAKPGRYALTKDHVTVLDALGMAGDLTIQGERIVKVIRREGKKQKSYKLDMTRMEDVVKSPAFYMQQDDVVYVDPNEYRKRQTTVNGNNMRSTSFYISLASLLTSISVLIFK